MLLVAVGIIVLLVIAQRVGLVDFSNKTRSSGGGGGAFGAMDEVFHPTRHEAQAEMDRQSRLPLAAPVPDGGEMSDGVYEGRVHIDLDERP